MFASFPAYPAIFRMTSDWERGLSRKWVLTSLTKTLINQLSGAVLLTKQVSGERSDNLQGKVRTAESNSKLSAAK